MIVLAVSIFTYFQVRIEFRVFLYKFKSIGKVSKALVGASAIKIILSVLAKRDSYGYDILQKVKELSGGRIKWNEGSIYPVLKKMEAQGMIKIKSYWRIEENERPRKYYNLLDAGKVELQNEKEKWNMVHSMLTKLWNFKTTE